jgi:DNA-binding transcriptional MocR family regulator
MLKGIEETFPEGKHTVPNGGFFVWYESKKAFDSKKFNQEVAVKNDILFVPGAAFYPIKGWQLDNEQNKIIPTQPKTNTMRLGYSYNNKEDIYTGITKLGKLLTKELS